MENLNYANSTALSQSQSLANTISTQIGLGNTIAAVTITLGFNELAALAPAANTPALEAVALAQVPTELAAYRTNYSNVLSYVRSIAPTASLSLLGYYDPLPANEASPAAPLLDIYRAQLNAIIQQLATQYGATYVNNAAPFVGNEAAYTYQAVLPAGSGVSGSFGSSLPISNVHPNALGYAQIAADVAAANVPEPTSWALLGVGLAIAAGCRPSGRKQLLGVV